MMGSMRGGKWLTGSVGEMEDKRSGFEGKVVVLVVLFSGAKVNRSK